MSENNNKNIVSSTNSYSQALYELANESNSLKEIEDQVSAILKLISESLDFNRLIKDPTNKQEDQLNVINLISDKFKFNKLLNKFLNFIIIKRRIYFIEEILKIFLEICSNQRGEITAKLISSKELNSFEIEKLKDDLVKYFGSNIKLNYKYDSSLIGGLIIHVGSIMVDTSIKSKLQQIQNNMIEA